MQALGSRWQSVVGEFFTVPKARERSLQWFQAITPAIERSVNTKETKVVIA